MFGIAIVKTSTLDALYVRIANLKDQLDLQQNVFNDLFAEHNTLSEEHEALKLQHDTLVELTRDPSTDEGKRSGLHAGQNHFAVIPEDAAKPAESVPDATGHSN